MVLRLSRYRDELLALIEPPASERTGAPPKRGRELRPPGLDFAPQRASLASASAVAQRRSFHLEQRVGDELAGKVRSVVVGSLRSVLRRRSGRVGVASSVAIALAALCWLTIGSGASALGANKSSATSAQRASPHPLLTAVLDASLAGADREVALRRMRSAGMRFERIPVNWRTVAPAGTRPAVFNPRDPGDPLYRWTALDDAVRSAVAAGIQPIITVLGAPAWAQSNVSRRPIDGPVKPSPEALADFATALASRYSGRFQGLPRVRYWQVWNEPNLSVFLMPQIEGGKAVSPDVVSGHGQRDGEGRSRGPSRQRRHRRRPRAIRGHHSQRSGSGSVPGAHRAARVHAADAVHVEGREPEANLRRDGRVRRLVASSVHERRADARGGRPGRRLARRPRRDEGAPRGGPPCRSRQVPGPARLLGDRVQLRLATRRPDEGCRRLSMRAGSPRRCIGCGATASRS